MAPTSVSKKSRPSAAKSTPKSGSAAPTKAKTLKRKNDSLPDSPAKKPKQTKVVAPTSDTPSTKDVLTSTTQKTQKPKPSSQVDIPTSISRPRKTKTTAPSIAVPKKATKTPIAEAPKPDSHNSEDENDGEQEEVGDAEDAELHGFSTDEDSSDDDSMDDQPSQFDMGKLPTVAKDDETVKRKLEKAKRKATEDRGVLFLGRLPHGFYEDQIKAYFSQFGEVTRLRVSRNKKTGKSKHYGFVEFDSSAVADIVAETMDNYLIMGHILQCKVIPKDQVHPELWVGANRKWRVVPQDRVAREQHNKPRTDLQRQRAEKRLLKRQEERAKKLEGLGLKYDFGNVGYKTAAS